MRFCHYPIISEWLGFGIFCVRTCGLYNILVCVFVGWGFKCMGTDEN